MVTVEEETIDEFVFENEVITTEEKKKVEGETYKLKFASIDRDGKIVVEAEDGKEFKPKAIR